MNLETPQQTTTPPWATEAVVRRVITESGISLAAGDHPSNGLWMGLFPNFGYAERFSSHWEGGDVSWMELCSVLDRTPFLPFAYGFRTFQEGFEQLAGILSTHYGITYENHTEHPGHLRLVQPIHHPAFNPDTQTWEAAVSDCQQVFEELFQLMGRADDLHVACFHNKKDFPALHHLLYSK